MKKLFAPLLLATCLSYQTSHAQDAGAIRGELHRQFQEWNTRALKGDVAAQTQLGDFHRDGKGVPQDFAEAARCYRKAAEQSYGTAQARLGYCYFKGSGVAKDWVEAYAWYDLASLTEESAAKTREAIAKALKPAQLEAAKKRVAALREELAAMPRPNGNPLGALSIGVGNAGLLGGDMTDPEDDVVGKDNSEQDLPEDQLKPANANWVAMKCAPVSPAGTAAHQRHPYQSWQRSPAAAVFFNRPEKQRWYVSFGDGGLGGPTPDKPYYAAVKFAAPFVLTHFTITMAKDMPERDPKTWAIQGSNTGEDNDWKDVFRCDPANRDASPIPEAARLGTTLFTSFTSKDLNEVVSPDNVKKLNSRLKGQPLGFTQFPRQTVAYAWYRIAVYSCFGGSAFSLSQLELFGTPAAAAAK